jgi:cytochrome oxidase Cu insertion factor (SCO1/SenC/PrrC family)
MRDAASCAIFRAGSITHHRTFYMIAEGAKAPDFTVETDEGTQVSLRDYRGHWVVLYFYPKADTPG